MNVHSDTIHLGQSNWRALAAIIASVSVVGLSLGLTIPLVSLNLEYRGYDSALIGLMAAMPAIGILAFSPLVPRLVGWLGARRVLWLAIMTGCFAVIIMALHDGYPAWLLLRLILGAANAVLFTVSETWINQLANEHNRGRLIAFYVTVLSLFFAVGPLVISITGSQGTLPFLVAGGILAVAALPLLWLGNVLPVIAGTSSFSVLGFFRVAPSLCAAVALFAFMDGSAISLLALFGLRHGYEESLAALMITALIIGNVFLQFPLGWLADRMNRYALLALCAGVLMLSSLLLTWLVGNVLLWPMLILLGAAAGGVYTLAMIIVGQRFSGAELVTANAAFGTLWGIGVLLGPLIGGISMHLHDPDGLIYCWALAAGLFLILFGYRRRMAEAR